MAGRGRPFLEKGYTFPKPLIEIKGKPMIQLVVENIKPKTEHRFIFIVLREHYEKYALKTLLDFIAPQNIIIPVERTTAGAACSVLLAKEFIDNDDELIIANADQYLDINFNDFINFSRSSLADGVIITFYSTHPKWSFVKADEHGNVIEVAEKKSISDKATAGIYYFKKGMDFVRGAESMIEKGMSINGEFYVCPVYNELILSNKKMINYGIDKNKMYGLGTPEDLEYFEKYYKEKI